MPLNVTLELPADLEERLVQQQADLNREVKEAYVLELFRSGRLTHYELSRVLGLDRCQTDAWLKHHKVFEGSLTMADLEADRQTLQRVMGEGR